MIREALSCSTMTRYVWLRTVFRAQTRISLSRLIKGDNLWQKRDNITTAECAIYRVYTSSCRYGFKPVLFDSLWKWPSTHEVYI